MPSGPKKRKKAAAAAAAAKKKEEEEMGISHPPNAALPPQQGVGEEKEEMDGHSSDVSIESVQPKVEDPSPILSEKLEAGGIGADVVEDACVCDRPTEILLEKGSVESSTTHLAEEEGEASEIRPTEIVLPEVESEEESVEASEVPVSVPADSALSEDEEAGEMPNMGTIIECSPPPLLEHRAAIWNCCGLLDVFNSSER